MTDKTRFSCYIKILYADGRGTSVRVKNGNCVLSIKGGEWRNAQEAKKLLVKFLTINDTRFDGWISQDHTCCRSLERE